MKSRNAIGWAHSFSESNTAGARVQIPPDKMTNPFRGSATDDTRIQINWSQLINDAAGGAQILSYNLEMERNGEMTELVG